VFVSFKKITWWVLKRGTIKAFTAITAGERCKIEASMVASFTIAATGREECITEGDEDVWRCTAAAGEASKIEGEEEVCTGGWEEEFVEEKKIEF